MQYLYEMLIGLFVWMNIIDCKSMWYEYFFTVFPIKHLNNKTVLLSFIHTKEWTQNETHSYTLFNYYRNHGFLRQARGEEND